MSENGLWGQDLYQETSFLVLLFLFLISLGLFFVRNRGAKFMAAWASLKSWLFAAPLLLVVFGLPRPWPLVCLTLVAILGAKTYFRMVGMYHRSWFVVACYGFIGLLSYLIYDGVDNETYNLIPMAFLGAVAFIPLARNSSKHMIQYMALSLMGFIFLGWSFLHLGRLLNLPQGYYIVLYIYILAEFSETISFAGTRFFGKTKLFSRISSRITLEGVVASILMTLLLAWAMRHLLPNRSEIFWITAGLSASIFGRVGDLTLSVIRRDLGIKESGVFIIGRDDILARLDKFIFMAPIFYYTFMYLNKAYGA